jgi:Flp pilus assembly protein TadG
MSGGKDHCRMQIFRRERGSRRSRQRGAQLVEVSLILIPLFGFTFLLLDLSMAIFIRATFQHAVRQGARYAITGANDTGPCQDDSIKAVVKGNALGFLNSTTASATIHVHWINPVNGSVADNSFGNIVGVTVENYSWNPIAPYQHSKSPLSMYAKAFDMMEAVPGKLPCISTSE